MGAIGLVLGYLLVPVAVALNGVAPRLQWNAVVALLAMAAAVAVLAYSTYRAVHRDRRRVDVRRAVNLLLLAKASALAGAVAAGCYAGFGLQFVDALDVALPRERAIRAGCAALAALALMGCGLLLERACRVPKVEEDG